MTDHIDALADKDIRTSLMVDLGFILQVMGTWALISWRAILMDKRAQAAQQ